MKKLFLFVLAVSSISFVNAQIYEFQEVTTIDCLPVVSQDNTGTCWSFSTSSFLESEIIRITGKKIDLSEMFQVRTTYADKAYNYVMRQGGAQFSQGGLNHDVINSVANYGLVPLSVYSGLSENENKHNHTELFSVLEAMVKTYATGSGKTLSPKWKVAINNVLDAYLGEIPTQFQYEGQTFTPESFKGYCKIKPEEYITITSFTHKPYYQPFILNIPDNFSNGSMYNVPLEEFIAVIDNALSKGFTLALDCDVSEPTFSAKYGVAFIPENEEDSKTGLAEIVKEKQITASFRQTEFENFNTTDDHLMHIVGKLKDQKGNIYYKIKNSWGSDSNRVTNGGYVYMSASYMKLKAISVLLNVNCLDKKLKNKLKL